jgi:hypothetical protein
MDGAQNFKTSGPNQSLSFIIPIINTCYGLREVNFAFTPRMRQPVASDHGSKIMA